MNSIARRRGWTDDDRGKWHWSIFRRAQGAVSHGAACPRRPVFSDAPAVPAEGELSRIVSLPAADAYFLMFYFKDVMHSDVVPGESESEIRRYRQDRSASSISSRVPVSGL